MAIKSFQHDGLERYFLKGSKAGIQTVHAAKLGRLLARLNIATAPEDMNVPGTDFYGLKGDLADHYAVLHCAVSVNGNWRLTFAFDGRDAMLVDYQDYR